MVEFYDEQKHKDMMVSICFDYAIGYEMPMPFTTNEG